MQQEKPERFYTIPFTITGRPDSAGLRIKSTNPTGIYISSVNPLAAQQCFEKLAIAFVIKRKLLEHQLFEGYTLQQRPLWNTILIEGIGDVTVCIATIDEIIEVMKYGHPELALSEQELNVEWWEYPTGDLFALGHDGGDTMDAWFMNAIQEDVERIKSRQQ